LRFGTVTLPISTPLFGHITEILSDSKAIKSLKFFIVSKPSLEISLASFMPRKAIRATTKAATNI
jgi:hypothetical protein